MTARYHNHLVVIVTVAAGALLFPQSVWPQAPAPATAPAEPHDPICETLFREYACGPKINSDVREAAIVLVASRGRDNGFWRVVVRTLRETNETQVEASCVQILGRMLAVDGRGREIVAEQQRTGQPYGGQWGGPYIVLDESAVAVLLQRAQQAENAADHPFIYYVRALADARDPRTREFLLQIMKGGESAPAQGRGSYSLEIVLTAARGLARLGEPAGIEWLIQNCDSRQRLPDWRSLPSPEVELGNACCLVLQEISDDWRGELTTKAEWQAWWQTARSRFATNPPATQPARNKP